MGITANVLLVEDSPEVSLSVREILNGAGHSVDEATNGKEGLDKITSGTYDLVVSDIWMPEMDGIALLKEIRGAGNDVPVVVISGGAPNAPLTYTAPLASTFGANAVIYKPFEKEELLKTIDAVMSGETIAPGDSV
ncbi:MAG: response regulator [Rhodospirillaceae bacterium]|nr:response regulator [Rhodospirillaceae bacterium]MBT5564581.1 response regulator [Rhodospirillaceae bacterium]MBT6090916.1 response regulator [Rhodospirillaceae bacterium]